MTSLRMSPRVRFDDFEHHTKKSLLLRAFEVYQNIVQ